MQLSEFVDLVPDFHNLSQIDQTLHFGWYLHHHKQKEIFGQVAIRECYKELNLTEPNTSMLFTRIIARRPRVVLKSGQGIKLEGKTRTELDKKYGQHQTTIAVSKMLNDLVGKLSNEGEKHFLSEAIKCYHVKAVRAAIIMAWNLTYDHLLRWILADQARVTAFNASGLPVVGKKFVPIVRRDEFEELKEANVLDICGNSGLLTPNIKKVLKIQLDKRNLAAHPSLVEFQPPQAEDTISSLINNVVLVLK